MYQPAVPQVCFSKESRKTPREMMVRDDEWQSRDTAPLPCLLPH